jgi:hypothetical protein
VQYEAEKILPPFHSQQHKKNATVLQVIFNNAWMLVVDILNISNVKESIVHFLVDI